MGVAVIVNPVAGGGRMARLWPEAGKAIAARFPGAEVRKTTRAGDACRFACRFAEADVPLILAVGGDGTIGEVANGILQAAADGHRNTALGVIACGTGSDFAHGLGLTGGVEARLQAIAGGGTRAIDAGRVGFVDDDGRLAERYFVNIASLGLSGPTVRAVNRARQAGRGNGRALFLWHTVRTLLSYRFPEVSVSVDEAEPVAARMALVAVANGPRFGGGMLVAPDARPDDGLFDIVMLAGIGKFGLLSDIGQVYRGAHRSHPAVTILRGRKVAVLPGEGERAPVLLDVDGESPGRLPATFEILPGALKLAG